MNNLDGIVSLFLACIEVVLLVNMLVFADKNRKNVLIFIIIFLLAGYQILEYLICGIDIKSSFMVYLAFADISLLPPLSLIFVLTYLQIKSWSKLLILIPALFFIIYYSGVIDKFAVVKCTVVYASYNYPLGAVYGVFYYLPIFISFLLLINSIRKSIPITVIQTKLLVTGHYFIIIPVVASFILLLLNLPGLLNNIESVLCKFAFGYAVTLAFFALNNRKS